MPARVTCQTEPQQDATSPPVRAAPASERDHTLDTLRRFLNAYWLRPENAFWMTLRSRALSELAFETRSADISCGDGVFSFLHAGGAFDPSFDVFQSAGHLDRVATRAADMFDVTPVDYAPPIASPPDWTIDVATDLKPNLLAKAAALCIYREHLEHDNNKPLPFPSETFATVYCNSAYWVTAIDAFLRELARVLAPRGRAVLHVKLAAMRDFTLEPFRSQLGERFLRIIGRGRMACWPTIADRSGWERRFERAGLQIERTTPFVTRTHAHIWDVGLRPIAPLLVRMANDLKPDTRAAIKHDWVALFEQLLAPICDPAFDLFAGAAEPAEIQYVLTR